MVVKKEIFSVSSSNQKYEGNCGIASLANILNENQDYLINLIYTDLNDGFSDDSVNHFRDFLISKYKKSGKLGRRESFYSIGESINELAYILNLVYDKNCFEGIKQFCAEEDNLEYLERMMENVKSKEYLPGLVFDEVHCTVLIGLDSVNKRLLVNDPLPGKSEEIVDLKDQSIYFFKNPEN